MAWVFLIMAGLVEMVMAVALKYTEGWTRLGPMGRGTTVLWID